MPHQILRDEKARLAALAEYAIIDTTPEPVFERMVDLVRRTIAVPMATVTFIDGERQWFKARRGIAKCETARGEAICDHTIRSDRPLVLPDLRLDARFRDYDMVHDTPPILSYLGAPLVTPSGYVLGALCALDHQPHDFSENDVAVMEHLAALVVDWLELRRIAQADYLTGAMTRRPFIAEAEREIARARRYGRPCALVVFDVDHFKSINDAYGHGGGDEVLRVLSSYTIANLRSGDLFARLGGEEFALLLPETDAAEALAVAEKLRGQFSEKRFAGCEAAQITASFGVAPLDDTIIDAAAWIDAADRALYRAKDRGRNRTVLSGS